MFNVKVQFQHSNGIFRISGNLTATPLETLEEAQGTRDRTQTVLARANFIVIFNGDNEVYVPSSIMQNSVAVFSIVEV